MKDSAIPGAAVAVTRGDQVLMVRGYGHDSTGEAVTGDSLFRIASLSKSFTALAVMQLVDAGLLGLDDPVQQHLPEFQLGDPRADQITVRQLLDHTSGLTDAMVPELSRTQPRTPTEATTSLRSAHLASTPGTSWSYHNPNYQVAARLVEVLSGEPFDRYLRHHILEPAGWPPAPPRRPTTNPSPAWPRSRDRLRARVHRARAGHLHGRRRRHRQLRGRHGALAHRQRQPRPGRRRHPARLPRGHAAAAHPERAAGRRVRPGVGRPTAQPAAPTRLEHSGTLFTFTAEEAIWPGIRATGWCCCSTPAHR